MSEAAALPISLNSTIRLHPLSKQGENGVVIVGRGDQFLELPREGLDFLTWLDEGLTLGKARERFEARYNPFPGEEVLEVSTRLQLCGYYGLVGWPIHGPIPAHQFADQSAAGLRVVSQGVQLRCCSALRFCRWRRRAPRARRLTCQPESDTLSLVQFPLGLRCSTTGHSSQLRNFYHEFHACSDLA